jgi:hypothetical protein
VEEDKSDEAEEEEVIISTVTVWFFHFFNVFWRKCDERVVYVIFTNPSKYGNLLKFLFIKIF